MAAEPAEKQLLQDWKAIQELYTIPDPESVLTFIRQHPSLSPVLIEAIDPLRRIFGPNVRLELEYWVDVEIPTWIDLFVNILVGPPPDPAIDQNAARGFVEAVTKKRWQFLDEWFLDQETDGYLNFGLEFK